MVFYAKSLWDKQEQKSKNDVSRPRIGAVREFSYGPNQAQRFYKKKKLEAAGNEGCNHWFVGYGSKLESLTFRTFILWD